MRRRGPPFRSNKHIFNVSANKQTLLRLEKVRRCYGSTLAVDQVSFQVAKGEFFSLLGPSGCGKSTTLRLIAGLEESDSGEIWLNGRLIASPERGILVPAEKRNIGLVFQSYAVWPHMTVAQNVAYPLEVRRWDTAKIRRRVGGGLGSRRSHRA
jgi:iron(III) transport system ATP-binding protein